jgi:hypothetical protein
MLLALGPVTLTVDLKFGYTVSVGHWRLLANRKVEIKFLLVTVEKVAIPINNKPQTLPGVEKTEAWTIVDGNSLPVRW